MNIRRLVVIFHDFIMIGVAWELAWGVRFNFSAEILDWPLNIQAFPALLVLQEVILWRSGLYRGLWRFASVPDLWNIVRAAVFGTLALALALFVVSRLEGMPRSVLLMYPVLLIFLLGAPRLIYRVWKDHALSLKALATADRVLILGAGRSGEMLVREMLRDSVYLPIAFLDDDPRLRNARVHGIPILGTLDDICEIVDRYDVSFVVIALPSVSSRQMQRVVSLCEETDVIFRTLPRMEDMMSGQIKINQLREVSIDDLLGREKVELDWDAIHQRLSGRTVMISGGGGSIGSELCRQVARLGPTSLIVFDRSEFNLFVIERDLRAEFPSLSLQIVLGDVCDPVAVEQAMRQHKPGVVFHAAAYKHVPMLQSRVREAVRNNVLGTRVLAMAAASHACESFVLISTDKAVNPTNIMGATKRVAEVFCENFGKQVDTRFITVRFGNVLDSAGSVVPIFRQQIEQGGPVTVTHPDIERYFMTIPEACQLILQAGAMGRGGEIFVLDMGQAVKISYLAEQMIRLSGRRPGEDIKIVYTGLRPGEKLYEELFHPDENLAVTGHEKILLARHRPVDWRQLQAVIDEMDKACHAYEEAGLIGLIRELVPEMIHSPESSGDNVVEIKQRL